MLAIATSIDALAVGVTFGTMGSKLETSIWASVILIGITTFAISLVEFLLEMPLELSTSLKQRL